MATNKSMIRALQRIAKLIDEIDERTEELNAWKTVLNDHITAQKKQHGQDWGDMYAYIKKMKKVKRV